MKSCSVESKRFVKNRNMLVRGLNKAVYLWGFRGNIKFLILCLGTLKTTPDTCKILVSHKGTWNLTTTLDNSCSTARPNMSEYTKYGITRLFTIRFLKVFLKLLPQNLDPLGFCFLRFLGFIIIAPSTNRNQWCSAWCMRSSFYFLPDY